MTKRCFLCMSKMDEKTGLCTNLKCARSQPLPAPKAEKYCLSQNKEENKQEK